MGLLFGEYDLTIDDKNRLLIPSDVRRSLDPESEGEAFFMIVGEDHRPWLYPEKSYAKVALRERIEMTPEEDLLAFDRMNFGTASRLEWDKQGRVVLPDRTIKRTALTREVTLVGVRDHMELWNRDEWQKYQDEQNTRRAEISRRARLARIEKLKTQGQTPE